MNTVDTQRLPRPNEQLLATLLDEIRRYLDAVEAFRAEGCDPRWV